MLIPRIFKDRNIHHFLNSLATFTRYRQEFERATIKLFSSPAVPDGKDTTDDHLANANHNLLSHMGQTIIPRYVLASSLVRTACLVLTRIDEFNAISLTPRGKLIVHTSFEDDPDGEGLTQALQVLESARRHYLIAAGTGDILAEKGYYEDGERSLFDTPQLLEFALLARKEAQSIADIFSNISGLKLGDTRLALQNKLAVYSDKGFDDPETHAWTLAANYNNFMLTQRELAETVLRDLCELGQPYMRISFFPPALGLLHQTIKPGTTGAASAPPGVR